MVCNCYDIILIRLIMPYSSISITISIHYLVTLYYRKHVNWAVNTLLHIHCLYRHTHTVELVIAVGVALSHLVTAMQPVVGIFQPNGNVCNDYVRLDR